MTGAVTDRVLLRVQTPEYVLFDGPVHWVQIPLDDGLVGVWPGHAPLVAPIAAGDIVYGSDAGEESIPVGAGILLVDEERCVALFSALEIPGDTRDLEALAEELAAQLEESMADEDLEELQQSWQ